MPGSFDRIAAVTGYARRMGPAWALFRVKHALRLRAGFFDRKDRWVLDQVSRVSDAQLLARPRSLGLLDPLARPSAPDEAVRLADAALAGRIRAFSWKELNYAPSGRIAWNYNPETGKSAPTDRSWHRIPDFAEFGDVKLIWELSRFPHLYALIDAHRATGDSRYARGAIRQILDWIRDNPYPLGPNFKCGQETAFRLLSWLVALEAFGETPSRDELASICRALYLAAHRIEINIEFASKSVRNNHSISEAVGLILAGIAFSDLPAGERWLRKGLRTLEGEMAYQVFADGSYIQHSFNYQRLALDVISTALLALERAGISAPRSVIDGHRKMTEFLRAFVQPGGLVPNYGANDGGLLYPLPGTEYGDFRPSLELAGRVNGQVGLFPDSGVLSRFLGAKAARTDEPARLRHFEAGGYYLHRDGEAFTFMRSHSFKTRPGQSDTHHLDFWLGGDNVFCDVGTYSYNPKEGSKADFESAAAHNTARVGGREPMERALQFGWDRWPRTQVLEVTEARWRSRADSWERTVEFGPGRLTVTDRALAPSERLEVHWHTPFEVVRRAPGELTIRAGGREIQVVTDGAFELAPAHRSLHYARKEPITRISITGEPRVRTEVRWG